MMTKKRSLLLTIICFVAIMAMPLMAFAGKWYQECTGGTNPDATFVKTMKEYVADNSCWFCDLFVLDTGEGGLFGAINKLVTNIYNDMAPRFVLLLGAGILFIILFKVAKILVSLQEVDVIQFLQDLFKPLGRAIVASTLLTITIAAGQDTIFSLIVSPVLDVSLELGKSVMNTSLENHEFVIVAEADPTGKVDKTWQWNATNCDLKEVGKAGDKAFGKEEGKLMRCWMEQVAHSLIVGIGLGAAMMSVGTEGLNFFQGGFALTICGFIIWGAFYLLYLMFPMKVIDAFVRLAFVLALAPLWITLWVFPVTVQYTKKAWDMFLSSCLLFAILGVMIALVVQIMDGAIPDTTPPGASNTLRKGLIACLKAGNDDAAISWVPFGGGAILNCLAFGAIGFTLLSAASTLANTFVGGGGDLGIGNSMAGLAAKGGAVAMGGAKMVGKGGMVVGGAMASGAGKAMGALNRGARWLGTPANGARPSALNRFFAGLGKERSANPLNAISNFADRLKNGPSGGGSSDAASAGADYGRLTEGARNDVDNSVTRDESAMVNAMKNDNSMSLRGNKAAGDILRGAKTERERSIMDDMMKTIKNGTTGRGKDRVVGMPTDAQRQALKDERARQKMAENAMNEQAYADRVKQDQATTAKKAGEKEARDFMKRYGPRARSEAEVEAIKNEWCKTDAERAVMDKYFKDTNRHRAGLNFEEEWGKVKAEQAMAGGVSGTDSNKPGETGQPTGTPKPGAEGNPTTPTTSPAAEAEERRKEAARHAAEAAAREQTREQQKDRIKEELDALRQTTGRLSSALSDLQKNSKSRASVEDLHANMAFIEQQVHSSRSREELENKLAGHQWQFSGDASMKDSYSGSMSSMAQDLWTKKETGDAMSVEQTIKKDISDCLNKYGGVAESDVLARHVATYSANDVMDGNSSAITSRLGRLLNK